MKEGKTFETAYERLEEILEKMNSEQVALDEALSLYEEADHLIVSCQKKLAAAEQKIEILVKNRGDQTPQTEEFTPTSSSTL